MDVAWRTFLSAGDSASDDNSDVDILTYSDSEDDFREAGEGCNTYMRADNYECPRQRSNVSNSNVRRDVEYHLQGNSFMSHEKQDPEIESHGTDSDRSIANDVSMGDSVLEKNGGSDQDSSLASSVTSETKYDSGYQANRADVINDDVSSCSGSADGSELDVEAVSSEDEYGFVPDLVPIGREQLGNAKHDSYEVSSRISENDAVLLKTSATLYEYMLDDEQVVYSEVQVNDCVVKLERLPLVTEQSGSRSGGNDGIDENYHPERLQQQPPASVANKPSSMSSSINNGIDGSYCSKSLQMVPDSVTTGRSATAGDTDSNPNEFALNHWSTKPKDSLTQSGSRDADVNHAKKSAIGDIDDCFDETKARYVCPLCGKEYKQRIKMKLHKNFHREKYKCKKCGRVFVSKATYKTHVRNHPDDTKYMFVCKICGKRFNQGSNLNTHVTLIHSTEPPKYICKICGLGRRRHCDLLDHVRKVHENKTKKTERTKPSTGKKRSPCPVCGGMFTEVAIHMRQHTGEKPFQCNVCERRFAQKTAMRTHQRIHTGERPYSCQLCDRTFRQHCHRATHMKLAHSEERKYKCTICGKAFKTNCQLKAHEDTHANAFSFICKICGAGCRSKRLLKSHMEIHNPERKFACTYCHMEFRHKSALSNHTMVHEQRWRFKCEECDKGFVRRDLYVTHLRKHSEMSRQVR